MYRPRSLALLLSFAAGFSPVGGHAVPALSSVGTLTCTTSDNARTAVDASLSCHFAAVVGPSSDYRGWIACRGAAGLPGGKRVLVWAVLAPEPEMQRGVLAGRYRGVTGGRNAANVQLKGGKTGAIVLEPVTPNSQVGDRATPSVLELRLAPAKA